MYAAVKLLNVKSEHYTNQNSTEKLLTMHIAHTHTVTHTSLIAVFIVVRYTC